MKNYLIFFLLVTQYLFGASNSDKTLVLQKTTEEIHIDGVIDPVWMQADSVTDFIQHEPYHNVPPSVKTVAKVLTTEEALYCLMKCYDERANIQQNKGKLDDLNGDVVSIMLDTFGNKRTAYKFAVSASGVRSDSRMLDDARNRDYSWDGIWFGDARVYDWGFAVEMKIPYKSIQYEENLTQWGLDFDRWSPARNEDIYWCGYEENEGQRISKFGFLVFHDFRPTVKGLHLEIYPVALSKIKYKGGSDYDLSPQAGIDIFYNPSPKLTYQLTANPDFAQIEADPFEFNISRYETYFGERRPFFTEGNEIFMASGKQRNTGFYRPMELFYSRRIGKKLPDGTEVPLTFGTKAFGRVQALEYGGFLAMTGEKDYINEDDEPATEERAVFGSARIKKQIMGNSSIGFLFVGKHTATEDNGVIDIDGAFRKSNWQLAYQLARSYKNSRGDFAGSAGFTQMGESSIFFARGRYVGPDFDIDQVGFVPWQGTGEFVSITGPRWYFNEGYIKQILIYGGGLIYYEDVDDYTDYGGLIGFNMLFRNNWGYEVNTDFSRSKDEGILYNSYNLSLSSWYHISPVWRANFYTGFSRNYNFNRDYLGYYFWYEGEIEWQLLKTLQIGTSVSAFIEYDPDGSVDDITYNARPFLSATPINDLNVRIYFDEVFVKSTDRVTETIFGLLFSYNFSPKSWVYFAYNEFRDRDIPYSRTGVRLPQRLLVKDRVGVVKLKYLYYF